MSVVMIRESLVFKIVKFEAISCIKQAGKVGGGAFVSGGEGASNSPALHDPALLLIELIYKLR